MLRIASLSKEIRGIINTHSNFILHFLFTSKINFCGCIEILNSGKRLFSILLKASIWNVSPWSKLMLILSSNNRHLKKNKKYLKAFLSQKLHDLILNLKCDKEIPLKVTRWLFVYILIPKSYKTPKSIEIKF